MKRTDRICCLACFAFPVVMFVLLCWPEAWT